MLLPILISVLVSGLILGLYFRIRWADAEEQATMLCLATGGLSFPEGFAFAGNYSGTVLEIVYTVVILSVSTLAFLITLLVRKNTVGIVLGYGSFGVFGCFLIYLPF